MKKLMIFVSLASFLWLPVSTAQSSDFIAARTAYIAKDFDKAARLFMELAREGDHRGQSMIGYMYEQGLGVQQNLSESLIWHQTAAQLGNGFSAHQVALAHVSGQGVQRDPVKANMWFTISIQRGFGWADRLLLEKNMTRDQVIRARQMAGDYMKKHNLTYKTKK